MSTHYSGVKIAMSLLEQVDRLVAVEDLGYRTRSEFVADSIRHRIEELEQHLERRGRLQGTIEHLERQGLVMQDQD